MRYIRFNHRAWFFKWELCEDITQRTGKHGDLETTTIIIERCTTKQGAIAYMEWLEPFPIKN